MEEMTISELLSKKKDLEERLSLIIRKFEEDTKIEISSIYSLRKHIHSNLMGDIKVPDIYINLKL